ncbi:hypothetical protein AgCh_028283 [Apium graveolens]
MSILMVYTWNANGKGNWKGKAVPLSAKKGGGGSPEGSAPFLQLPHFSEAVIKKIARKFEDFCDTEDAIEGRDGYKFNGLWNF